MGLTRTGTSTLALCAMVVTVALAQRTTDFGAMAGGTFSKFRGPHLGNFDRTTVGVTAGVFVTLGLTPQFALQPEVLYVQKGGRTEVNDQSLKISYIEVPLLAKFRIPAGGKGRNFSPHLYAGGALGFKVGCNLKSGSPTLSCEDIGAEVKTTDFSLVFGAGVNIGRVMIDARLDLGLSKIGEPDDDAKNEAFYLLAGWGFRSSR